MFTGRVTAAFFLYFQKFKSNHMYTYYEKNKSTYLKEITQKRALVYRMIGLDLSDVGHSTQIVSVPEPLSPIVFAKYVYRNLFFYPNS